MESVGQNENREFSMFHVKHEKQKQVSWMFHVKREKTKIDKLDVSRETWKTK